MYLVGFMGAGKSTVGKALSALKGFEFIDLDSFIEKTANSKIPEIFSEFGEEKFRELETESLVKVSELKGKTVVSTGGGIMLNPENIHVMQTTGTTIYLKAGIETIWERIKDDRGRPLLNVENPLGTATELLNSRKHLYEGADIIVETDNLTPQMISEKINKVIYS